MPSHESTSTMPSTASSLDRDASVSSIRRTNVPPVWRANNQLNSAVRADPTCNHPEGAGLNRTLTSVIEGRLQLAARVLEQRGHLRRHPQDRLRHRVDDGP